MTRVESITVAPSTERKTAPGRFEAALQGAARNLASGLGGAVELAAPAVPFGTVLSGAVRGTGGSTARFALGGGASSAVAAATGSGSGEGDVLQATRALQQESQAFNLQYLELQERLQRESREFTALSNVMKVKHDTARAAVGNIH